MSNTTTEEKPETPLERLNRRHRTRGLRPPWKPGQSGNPKGRPRASPEGAGKPGTKAFHDALQAEYEREGQAAIARLRKRNPGAFLNLCASVFLAEDDA
jgi:hypothetical protein